MSIPTDAASIPPDIRKAAFQAALVAVRVALDEHGHRLDALGLLELLDIELNGVEAALGIDGDDRRDEHIH